VGIVASWLLASPAGLLALHPGESARLPIWIAGAALLVAGLVFAMWSFSGASSVHSSGRKPWIATLAVYTGGLLLAAGLLYPTLVPPEITVDAAASPHSSLLFLTVGVGFVIPIILAYQVLGYSVFRGKFTLEREGSAA
jgi:cytochrome bd ubiquinol oxidase subunit II